MTCRAGTFYFCCGFLQERVLRTAAPILHACFEPLAHCRNIATLSLMYKHYFGRSPSKLAELVLVPYSRRSSSRYCNSFNDFSVTLNILKISLSTVSFLMQLDTGIFPTEFLILAYDLNASLKRLFLYIFVEG